MLVKIYIESNPRILNISGKIPDTDIDRIVTRSQFNDQEKWVVDSEQIKSFNKDIELYLLMSPGEETPMGYFSDAFEQSKNYRTNKHQAVYVMNINPADVKEKLSEQMKSEDLME